MHHTRCKSSRFPAVSLNPFSVTTIAGLLNLSLIHCKVLRIPNGVIFNHEEPDLYIDFVIINYNITDATAYVSLKIV